MRHPLNNIGWSLSNDPCWFNDPWALTSKIYPPVSAPECLVACKVQSVLQSYTQHSSHCCAGPGFECNLASLSKLIEARVLSIKTSYWFRNVGCVENRSQLWISVNSARWRLPVPTSQPFWGTALLCCRYKMLTLLITFKTSQQDERRRLQRCPAILLATPQSRDALSNHYPSTLLNNRASCSKPLGNCA